MNPIRGKNVVSEETATSSVVLRNTTSETRAGAKVSFLPVLTHPTDSLIRFFSAPRFWNCPNNCFEYQHLEKPGFGWHLAGTTV
jgi:hypothetical protein